MLKADSIFTFYILLLEKKSLDTFSKNDFTHLPIKLILNVSHNYSVPILEQVYKVNTSECLCFSDL